MRGAVDSCRSVWAIVTADRRRVGSAELALVSEARRLAAAVGSVSIVLAFGVDEEAEQALARVAGRVIATPAAGPDGQVALAASVIADDGGGLILLPEPERDLPGRLAARLGAGVVAGCSSVEVHDGRFILRRPVYAGLVSATLAPEATPIVASMLSSALRLPAGSEVGGAVERREASSERERVRVVGRERLGLLDLPLSEAEVIVAGGLGLGGPENVRLLEELADALGGTIAGSRPVVDRGWLPAERQVGQSGAIVVPKVYVACGISGAPQHVVGIRAAGAVIAVNKDPGAPIMKLADVPIVGDLREVLPALTAAVRSAGGPLAASLRAAREAAP